MTRGAAVDPLRERAAPPAWAQLAVLACAVALLWHSLGDHGLFPPDEGRYAAVSGWMASHGNWLAPEIRGQLHITKPPLAYWAQAASIRLFGSTEFAVRAPSALASSLLILALFAFARRTAGALVATLAVGLVACMPLFEIVGRLAITDPMVALWWWCALCAGWLALRDAEPRHGWTAAFWAFTALLGLTKGPLLLGPPAIVAAWLLLAGRGRDLLRLHPWLGLPLAAAPLAMVAWGFWAANPERAMAVWRHEFVDRVAGGGHDDPWWQIPMSFVVGLFPASAMLTLPWFNLSWRRALAAFRRGDLRALLLVAVVLPFLGFSVLRGTSPTYVLPLVAPTAMLVALMLARWIDGSAEDAPAGTRMPDVRITSAVVMTAIGIGLPAATAVIVLRGKAPDWLPGWSLLWLAMPVVPAMVASWIAVAWWRRRELRLPALGAAFVATLATWVGYHRAEDVAMRAMSTRAIAEAVPAGRPLAVVGLKDLGIDWCRGEWTAFPDEASGLDAWIAANPSGAVIVEDRVLRRMRFANGPSVGRLAVSGTFDAFMLKRVHVCDVAR